MDREYSSVKKILIQHIYKKTKKNFEKLQNKSSKLCNCAFYFNLIADFNNI